MFTIKNLETGEYFHSHTPVSGSVNQTDSLEHAPQWDTWANAYKQLAALKADGFNDYGVVRITFTGSVVHCN